MIWIEESSRPARQERMAARIVDDVYAVCGQEKAGASSVWEIAQGVAAFLSSCHPAQTASRQERLELTSHALQACGEPLTSWRVEACAAGIVRSASWTVAASAPMWIIDLKPLAAGSTEYLELGIFQGLRRTIEAIGDVWTRPTAEGFSDWTM